MAERDLSMNPADASTDDIAPRFEPQAATVRRLAGAASPKVASHGRAHSLNNWLAVALVSIVALAVIPLGSNRPAFWTIWGVVLGMAGLAYAGLLLILRAQPRVRVSQFWPEAVLFLAICLFLLVQLLPMGRWLPRTVTLQDGSTLSFNSISLDPGSTWLTLLQFATFAMLFYLVAQVAANRQRARRIMFALMLVVAAFALYGILALTQFSDTLLGFEKKAYLGFATGTFVNRNSFATFLAAGLAIGVAFLLETLLASDERPTLGRRVTEIAAILVCLAAIGGTLLATGSRMGVASAACGVLVVTVLSLFAVRGNWRIGLWVVLAGALLCAVMVPLYGTELIERLVFTPGVDQGRIQLHRQVLAAILQRPWLGHGGGSFASTFPLFQEPGAMGAFIWDHAHSTYLALWYELGVVFGSLPLLIVGCLTARALHPGGDGSRSSTGIAAVGVVVVFAVHSLLDFSAEIEANALLLTAVLALGASNVRVRRSSPPVTP